MPSSLFLRRLGLTAALLFGVSPLALVFADPAAPPKPKTQQYTGKVVPLAQELSKAGARLDADAAPYWLALAADDGKTYPLIKDDGSRMFFKDARLLDRPMRLTARRLDNPPLLQVLQVHSLVKGQPHEVYYWCVVCAIKRFEKLDCECCGDPMELREEPVPR
jgi:hypothetical protein